MAHIDENKPPRRPGKRYLGDGVYIEFRGFDTVLTTENGIEADNTIILEPTVLLGVARYALEVLGEDAV